VKCISSFHLTRPVENSNEQFIKVVQFAAERKESQPIATGLNRMLKNKIMCNLM
jgi:hypothetical protein